MVDLLVFGPLKKIFFFHYPQGVLVEILPLIILCYFVQLYCNTCISYCQNYLKTIGKNNLNSSWRSYKYFIEMVLEHLFDFKFWVNRGVMIYPISTLKHGGEVIKQTFF